MDKYSESNEHMVPQKTQNSDENVSYSFPESVVYSHDVVDGDSSPSRRNKNRTLLFFLGALQSH